MLCIYSVGSNIKPSAEEVEACNNTSSFSLTLNNLRWARQARQKPQEYIQRQYTHVIRFNVASGVWCGFCRDIIEWSWKKKIAGKAFQWGGGGIQFWSSCATIAFVAATTRFSHCAITPSVSKKQFSDRPVQVCVDRRSLCPRMTPATVIIREWSATYCRAHFVVEH